MAVLHIYVANRYRLDNKVDSDGRDTYNGTDTVTGEEVLVKLEPIVAGQLEDETRIYQELAGGVVIPFVHWAGCQGENYAAVFDRPGPNLEEVSNLCNGRFSLKTVLWLADQLISGFEYIHRKSLVYRDVIPQNFHLGRDKLADHVYIANFGQAKRYKCKDLHIPYMEYTSLNVHRGVEHSRRDDMEFLGYLLLDFCHGSRPWQGLQASMKEERYKRIMGEKKDTPTEVLCRGLPDEFLEYLNYCRSLRFDEEPNYHYLREKFRMIFQRESFQLNCIFDWTVYRNREEPKLDSAEYREPALQHLAQPVFLSYSESDILAQPKVEPISLEALVNEVKGIYAALDASEKKCKEIISKQRSTENPSHEEWRTLTASHGTLLCHHHDFFRASQHPSSHPALRNLAKKYNLPGRMWKHGIYHYLELLRAKPARRDHFLAFLRRAYPIIASLMVTIPNFEEVWTECLGDLARYWIVISNTEFDRKLWRDVARFLYGDASSKSPKSGRISHHLAVVVKPDIIQELFYYSKALVSEEPFGPGRESMMLFFDRLLGTSSVDIRQPLTVEDAFVIAHALLFKRGPISLFDKMVDIFISGIDAHARRERDLFQMQGSQMACILCAALLELGNSGAFWNALHARHDQEKPRSAVMAHTQDDLKLKSPRQHLDPSPPLSDSAHIPDHRQFGSSKEILIRACLFFRSTICSLFKRVHHELVLPFAHSILVFVASTTYVDEIIAEIERFMPWKVIAEFLNTVRRTTAGVRFESTEFLYRTNDIKLPLLEDYSLRGFLWTQRHFPPRFFEGELIRCESMVGLPSHNDYRAERLLRLGFQLALKSRWLKYDAKTQQFSITTFANSLEKDFMTRLSNPLTRSFASGFDLDTDAPSSPSLSVRLKEKEPGEEGEKEVKNENSEEEEVEDGEGGPWTVVMKASERVDQGNRLRRRIPRWQACT